MKIFLDSADINEIKEAINNMQISSSPPILNEFTSVMGAHTGPGTIAIALLKNWKIYQICSN